MKNIISSASKIGLLMVIASMCTAFIIGIVRGTITLDTKDFAILVVAPILTFYFSNKGDQPNNAGSAPFLGK